MAGLQVFSAGLIGIWSAVLCIGLHSSLSSLWWPLIRRVSRYQRKEMGGGGERGWGGGERGQEELGGRNWNEIKCSLFRHSPQDLCPNRLQYNFRMSLVRGEEDLWLVLSMS